MNFKKVLSVVLAGAMSLSMVNGVLAVTEGTGNVITLDSFDSKTNGWDKIYRGGTSFSKDKDHTGNNGGSLKFEALTYGLGYSSGDCGMKKDITASGLKKGKTYKVSAWVYGERVKGKTTNLGTAQDNASSVYFDFGTDVNNGSFPDNVLGDSTITELKQGEWTKVESYFVAQGTKHTLSLKVPYYYDDKKYRNNYDIYYVDDITLEEQTNADILHYTPNYDTFNNAPFMVNKRSYSRLNPDLEIKAGAKYIDLTETQRYIKLGETAELNAFIVNAVTGQKASTITRNAADNQYISVTTNEDFLKYNNGVFIPVNTGTTVATVTYNDGEFSDTRNLLVTVYDDGAQMCSAETMDTWQYPNITDPLNKKNEIFVGTTTNYVNGGAISAATPISADKHTVISYRSYFPGGDTDDTRMGAVTIKAGANSWLVNGGGSVPLYIQGTNMGQVRPGILTGWNNIDYVFEPVGENTSNVTVYLNGKAVATASNVTMPADETFSCIVSEGVLIDDFKAVTVGLEPKVSEVDLPAEGETLSTLGDFNITFTNAMTVSDGGIKVLDSENNETTIRLFASDDNRTYRVKAYGGYKANTDYRLIFDPEKIALASNSAVKLSSSTGVYTFKTDDTKVSDVIGKGYTLLNAQHDMIGNGIYTLGSTAHLVEGTNELTASYVSQTENFPTPFTFTAEDSFVKDTRKADRYIVEFDAKIDMKEITATTKCNEWLVITAVDKDGKSIGVGRMGTDPWSDGAFTYRYSGVDTVNNADGWSWRSEVSGNNNVQLFGKYMHFKYVYEFGQNNENGNIKQTVYMTDITGTTYTYGPVYGFGSIGEKFDKTLEPVAIKTFYWNSRQMADRDLSIKNVSMYALEKSAEVDEAVEAYEFMVLDENSNVAETITGGNKYSVSCKVKNNSYTGDSLTVIAGVYTADNKLIAVKTATTAAPVGTEDTVTFDTLDISSAPVDGTYVLKVFCWNSLDAGVPVTEIIYPLAQ